MPLNCCPLYIELMNYLHCIIYLLCFALLQAPDVIIALYNNVIDHISQAISNDRLRQYSWPVPEFLSHDTGELRGCM